MKVICSSEALVLSTLKDRDSMFFFQKLVFSALKMEALCSYENMAPIQNAIWHNPEDNHLCNNVVYKCCSRFNEYLTLL